MATKDLGNFDLFFFYGEGNLPLELETESDITWGLVQRKRTLFYDRQSGSDLFERENFPNAITIQVGLRFDVANFVARRNLEVGSSNLPDRRVAVSQSSVSITSKENGEIEITVIYIPFSNFNTQNVIALPLVSPQ